MSSFIGSVFRIHIVRSWLLVAEKVGTCILFFNLSVFYFMYNDKTVITIVLV